MLIDWFTVGAQLANFLILVWLLKRFLYRPVLQAIDAREKRIAAALADADAKKAEAVRERDDFQAKNEAAEAERGALLAAATEEAKRERDRLLGEARKDGEDLRARLDAALRSERARLAGEITRLVAAEVFAIARKALADLANVSLEERMGEVFTRRLRDMDPKARESLAGALRASAEPAVIRSAFEIGPVQRAAVQNALNEVFSADIRVRFETAAAGACGIELSAGGQKVAWNIADYLSSLERRMSALLDAPASPADVAPHGEPAQPALRSVA